MNKYIIFVMILIFILIFYNQIIYDTDNIENFNVITDISKKQLLNTINSRSADKYIINTNYIPKSIAIVTLETRDMEILKIHNLYVEYYSKKHNYDYIFADHYDNKLDLPIYWKKLQIVYDILIQNEHEYIVWLDSDTIICHPEIPLEYLINCDKDKSIFIGKDYPSSKKDVYCAGVFIIHNDHIGVQFIKDCINTYINRKKCIKNNKYSLIGKWAGECYEQGIMNELINKKYKSNTHEINPSFVLNSTYPSFDPIILHLCIRNKENITDIFKQHMDNYIELFPLKKNKYQYKIAIIILYYKNINKDNNIKKWKKINVDIYIINKKNVDINSSIYDRYCITKAFKYFDFFKYDFVFKITGNNFFSNFEKNIECIPSDAELILQNEISNHEPNSELVGFDPKIIINILSYIDEHTTFEKVLKKIAMSKKYKTYRLIK